MKLGQLKAAIKAGPNPILRVHHEGRELHLTLQKGPLLEQLDKIYPDRTQETNLYLRPDGYLSREGDT